MLKIMSVKKGFTSDHSSTSYEFLAVDKPLDKKERESVAALSSRAQPTSREVSFVYHAEGYDIPGGWEPLLEKYYDVMYSESYDWWTLAIAFNTSTEQITEIKKYEFTGEEDMGIEVTEQGKRVIITINCRLDPSSVSGPYGGYEDYDDDDEEEEESDLYKADDELLNLLAQIREQCQQGDFRVLYAVWKKYSYEDDEDEAPPIPVDKPDGEKIIEQFTEMLDTI